MPPPRENVRRERCLPLEKTEGGRDASHRSSPREESKLAKFRTFGRRNETSNKDDVPPAEETRGSRGAPRRRDRVSNFIP